MANECWRYNSELVKQSLNRTGVLLDTPNALWLLALAEALGISQEETIGVGDTTNDMNLIQLAGLGLAMDNAYQELKDAADAVICSNKEHAIKYILEHYIKR